MRYRERMRRHRWAGAAGLAVAGAVTLPGLAAATTGWTPPTTFTGQTYLTTPAVAVNDDGSSIVAWSERAGDTTWRIRVARRVAGGPWTTEPIATTTERLLAPVAVADVDANGNAIVAWSTGWPSDVSTDRATHVRSFDAARGRWSSSAVISAPDSQNLAPWVRLSDDGTALAGWPASPYANTPTSPMQGVLATRDASGRWTAPEVVCQSPGVADSGILRQVLEPGPGRLTADCVSTTSMSWLRTRTADGRWGEPLVIPGTGWSQLTLESGRILAVGYRRGGLSEVEGLKRVERPEDGGAWGAVESIDDVGNNPRNLLVGSNDAGTTIMTWISGRKRVGQRTTHAVVTATVRTAGGTWSAQKQISPINRRALTMRLATPGTGPASVIWAQANDRMPDTWRLYAKQFDGAGDGWTHAEPIAAVPANTSIGFDAGASGSVAAWAIRDTSVSISSRGIGPVSSPRLSVQQLRINQRISQAALRRIAAVESLLSEPLPAARIRVGALSAPDFAPEAGVSGDGDGSVRAPVRTPIVVPPPAGYGSPGTVTLSARQLRINQRISQAAVRRVAALETRLRAGLTGGDLAPGAVTAAAFAGGVTVSGSVDSPTPAPTTTVVAPAPPRSGGTVRLSAQQLRINQRISGGVVRRVNALITQLEYGVRGDQIRDGSLTRSALSAALR